MSQDKSGHAKTTNNWKVSVVETTQVYLSFTLDSIIGQQMGHSGVGLILSSQAQGPRLMDQPQS